MTGKFNKLPVFFMPAFFSRYVIPAIFLFKQSTHYNTVAVSMISFPQAFQNMVSMKFCLSTTPIHSFDISRYHSIY